MVPRFTRLHSLFALAPVLFCVTFALGAEKRPAAESLSLVPWPKSVALAGGELTMTNSSRIVVAQDELLPLAKILAEEIVSAHGVRLSTAVGQAGPGDIGLQLAELKPAAYAIRVDDRASVSGADYNSVSQGTVTLLQSLRVGAGGPTLPKMTIEDQPHFAFCGAMLDIARKPHSIATLKQCVLAARMYKIRYIQLHMSDENAWTFPSTAFPQLGSTNFAWAGGDKAPVYKLNELKELVAFADARGVTFIPELETPGHSGSMRGAMLETFGYKDASGKIVGRSVINIASDRAYQALDTIVGEMCAVFKSSPYFHIGCDEASLNIDGLPEVEEWAKRHNLPQPHVAAVFGYHVQRMNEIVKKHGKRMIVWEGAPLDPIAPPKDVIFMPWVGDHGMAAEYVRRGYSIINPPWGTKRIYFDPYEVNGAQLPRGEKLLIGAAALSWQATEDQALPFIRYNAALRNEPTYNPASGRDLEDFLLRHGQADLLLDKIAAGFTLRAVGLLDRRVFDRPEPMFADKATVALDTHLDEGKVRGTLDGSEPTAQSPEFQSPLTLTKTTTIKARRFSADGKPLAAMLTREFRKVTTVAHDAVGAKVTIEPEFPGYYGPGPKGLTDGVMAAGDACGDPGWLGWHVFTPITITLDLGAAKEIHSVSPHFGRSGGGLEIPQKVSVLVSDDGRVFREVASAGWEAAARQRGWYIAELKQPAAARYVRVVAIPRGEWTFMDEVAVNGPPPKPILVHAARGKKIVLATPPNAGYSQSGIESLTDGHIGLTPHCANLGWLGWEGKNIVATIDLGAPTRIRSAGGHFMQFVWAGIYIPQKLEILVSDDGKQFKSAAVVIPPRSKDGEFVRTVSADLKDVTARYVRLIASTNGMWLFIDEIMVNPEETPE